MLVPRSKKQFRRQRSRTGLAIRQGMRSLNETTQLIRDEHKKLRGLFRQLEVLRSRTPEMFYPVIAETCAEIQVYVELEERVFFLEVYKALKAKTHLENPVTEFVHQALLDHAEIVRSINQLNRMIRGGSKRTFSSELDENIDDLVSLVEAYIQGEEKVFLPQIELHLPQVDAGLSLRWQEFGDDIRKRIHATSPDNPMHAQNPNGGEQQRRIGL